MHRQDKLYLAAGEAGCPLDTCEECPTGREAGTSTCPLFTTRFVGTFTERHAKRTELAAACWREYVSEEDGR